MKKILITPLVLILITIPTLFPYFNSKFFYTQDYIFIARLQQMNSALFSGQFPVRWAPDLRYGEPLYNFYAPLPYYVGSLIHLLGFNYIFGEKNSFIWVAKILFILSSLLSAFAMYLLANKLFGKRAGLLAAVLYTYAPYRAVDMYVRGALSETWAFIFFPLIFYCSLLISKKANIKNISLLALSLAGLFLTHNVTTLMFLPFLFIWWIYLAFKEKKWLLFLDFFKGSLLGFGLGAFFLLPATFERSFIQTKYLIVGYFNFRAHFVAFKQLFSQFWGYGSSVWGLEDGLSFQVGLANFAVFIIAIILGIIYRKDKKTLILVIIFTISFILSLFLQHNKSAFVWEAIPLMAFIQFPWRFLGIAIFIAALMGGLVGYYLKDRLFLLYFVLIAFTIFSALPYFKPKEYADDSFFDKFLSVESMQKGVDLTKDYLPIWVQNTDADRFDIPRSEKGEIKVSNLIKNSDTLKFSVEVPAEDLIEVPITYFPGWTVRANNQIIPQSQTTEMGLVRFKLPEGNYNILVEFKDTLIRQFGNIISLISFLTIFLLLVIKKYKLR